MKNILTIMKKEFARFFKDRRMVLTTLLPAILIYVLYSFMGTALTSIFQPDGESKPWISAVNMPEAIIEMLQTSDVSIVHIKLDEVEGVKEKISKKETDICMIFPLDFDEKVAVYDVQTATGPAPNVEVYYNSTVPSSSELHLRIYELLDTYEASLANKFDVNQGIAAADLATAEEVSAMFISMLMPMLLMIFLFSGCMGLALESITGEKERGTIATLLVTPLKRSELAIGKILSLATLSFLSGLVTAMSTILSLPNLMSGAEGMISTSIYEAKDYALLAMVILSTLLLLVAAISIVSAFAKTVKEASSAVMPLMIIVMLVGVTGMFGGGAQTEAIYYIVPVYNSVQSMSGIFSLEYSTLNIVLACISNLIYASIGGFALTKMFNSEKVMFSR